MSCRKVVIIDDEPIICNLIKRLGEWDRLNLEIVGSATDGLEGYRLIRELHPDIVLLDIRMPGLDGLELIEKCSEEKLTPRFIIISGYQEFEYAKKAIHFNISDYLVKPIDREELNMALKKSCLAIEEAQQKQTALQSLQMTIKEKNMHLWRAFFEKIIKGEPVPNFPDSYTGEPWPAGAFPSVCIGVVKLEAPWENKELCEQKLLQHFTSLWEERMAPYLRRCGYAQLEGDIIFLTALEREEHEPFRKLADTAARLMDRYIQAYDGCHATAGLSFCKAEAGLLTECLRQARFSLNCRFLNERGSAYLYSEISSSFVAELLPVLTDDSWGEKLRLAFTNLDSSAFKRLLASIYVGDVGIQGVKSRLALQRFSNELFSVAGSFGEFDQAAEEKRNYTNWLCETIEKPKQLYEEAGRILEQQFSRYLESQMMWNDRHVRAALRYISAHFSEDIQLDDLAAAVGLNPAYLSGLLKNKTGMTYSEHLLKARMERAKELLAGSNAIVKSVCYEVGYRDVKYFSRLFSQYTGVNPSIYQKMHSIL